MHTKIWWSYVHIRYLVHVQKWTYLALGWPYGWALNFNSNGQVVLRVDALFVIAGGHMYFHRTVRDRMSTEPLRNLTCIEHVFALTMD